MTRATRRPGRPIRVLQSFGPPRATTNPYIHMLDEALGATEGLEHLRFGRVRALVGRYDVVHFHWPETLLGGRGPARRLARRAFAGMLRLRLAASGVAVVRTVHNLATHEEAGRWERGFLRWLDARTDHRILLTDRTPVPDGAATTVIPHGHYRDWFAALPRLEPDPGTLAFVGLVRPYKGLEELLDAFRSTAERAPQLRLRIAGRPIDDRIASAVRDRAALDTRVDLRLAHVSEQEFANTVMTACGVVLPYRAMHNSGALLAALSLQRPVLAPSNEITRALGDEVGPGWVTTFDGALTGDDLLAFAALTSRPPPAPPELAARDWSATGERHLAAYLRALEHRGGRARS